jgi:hypothetical protein
MACATADNNVVAVDCGGAVRTLPAHSTTDCAKPLAIDDKMTHAAANLQPYWHVGWPADGQLTGAAVDLHRDSACGPWKDKARAVDAVAHFK